MNVERLIEIRKIVKKEAAKGRLDMESYFNFKQEPPVAAEKYKSIGRIFKECGTAACIAGWTILMYKPKAAFDDGFIQEFDIAQDILDLTYGEADRLFDANSRTTSRGSCSTKESIERLDHLIEQGKEEARQARKKA